jgi:hypothetical protein
MFPNDPERLALHNSFTDQVPLDLARPLGVAGDDLNFVRKELIRSICLEFDVLDEECPDIVAEAVGLEVSLTKSTPTPASVQHGTHLEVQA